MRVGKISIARMRGEYTERVRKRWRSTEERGGGAEKKKSEKRESDHVRERDSGRERENDRKREERLIAG